ncbi:MAG: hypothetical protein HY549_03990 [Elusimicrobia bacterium]|nr:hypothetical protein [Elusimicrobiota bacterium]
MPKIIGFKIPLRIREVQRRGKKLGLKLEEGEADERALQEFLNQALKALRPAVLFDTFPHPDPEQPLLSPMPGLAYSLVLATLGPKLAAFRGQNEITGIPGSAFWPAIEEVALEETVRFATSLLEGDAAGESCELSPLVKLSEAPAMEAVLRKLDSAKIGVSLMNGAIEPSATCAFSLSWLSKSKSKGKARQ